MAKVMMLIVTFSILTLTVVGFWFRRPLAFVLVFLSIGYLVVADGGIFPSAEHYLPTERGLARYCPDHMETSSGFKFQRSRSLTKWVLAVDPDHYDWRRVNPAKPAANTDQTTTLAQTQSDTNDVLDTLLEDVNSSPEVQTYISGVTIKLPVMAVTSVSTVVSFYSRDFARSRPYFIVGHCLIVTLLLAVAITYLITTSKRTCATNRNCGATRAQG